MLWKHAQDTLGKNTLLKALNNYAEKYKFEIASEDDLWNALDEIQPGSSNMLKDYIKAV